MSLLFARRLAPLGAVLALVLCHGGADAAKKAPADPVVFSFATVGDSRADPASATTRQDLVFLQNSRALARILREIQAVRPQALFFNGDMIMGYGADRAVLNRQYGYWRGMVAGLMETGTYVVPVSGNHEMQHKSTDPQGRVSKVAREENAAAWRDNMGDLILDTARWQAVTGVPAEAFDAADAPAVGGPDGIVSSQQQLSYSFDAAGSHFAVVNTDPVGNDGHGPAHWLAQDFAKAKARGAKRYFVFGHKPAYTYFYKAGVAADGMDIFPDNAKAFWAVVEQYGATYFCGHQHIYNAMQPALAEGGKAWQIMVGSGGSPFSAGAADSANPQDRMYAWALVRVHASGRVRVEVSGFDERYGATVPLRTLVY